MIRRAVLTDLTQLSFLFDLYRVFYKKESDLLAAKNFLEERLKNDESVVFVSENEEGVLTGFLQLYPLFSSTRMKRLWLLNDLFVKNEFRSQGISVQLMEAAQDFARKTNSAGLILETAKDNEIGNNLYPRVGFSLDTEHNYYSWET